MALEEIGFSAVIKGVAQYVSNAQKIISNNRALAQSATLAERSVGKSGTRFVNVATGQFVNTAAATAQISAQKAAIAQNALLAASNVKLGSSFKVFATNAAGGGLNIFRSGIQRVLGPLDNFQNKLAKAALFLGRLQFVAISSLAALAAIASPVIFAAGFEKQLSRIVGLTQTPKAEIAGLRKEIIELSKEIGKSPTELAAGAYFILSSGIKDTATAMEVLRLSAKAAQAGLGDTQTVAKTITAVLNAYQLSAGDAALITDVLVQTVTLGSGEASELAASLGFVIPLASQMGIEFEQVGAILATLTNQGLNAAESVTALTGIMTQIVSPSEKAKKIFDVLFEGTGIDLARFRQMVDEDAVAAFKKLVELAHGSTAVLSEIFPERRGLVGFLAAFTNQLPQTEANLEGTTHAVRANERAYAAWAETTSGKATIALTSFKVALTELGTRLLPAASKALDGVRHAMEQLSERGPQVFRDWLPVLQEVGRELRASADAVRNFQDQILAKQAAIILAITAIGVALAYALGPTGVVILGVGATVAAISLIKANVDDLGISALTVRLRLLEMITSLLDAAQAVERAPLKIPGIIIEAAIPGDTSKFTSQLDDLIMKTGSAIGIEDKLTATRRNAQTQLEETERALVAATNAQAQANRFTDLSSEKYIHNTFALAQVAREQGHFNTTLTKFNLANFSGATRYANAVATINEKVKFGIGFNQALVDTLNDLKIPLDGVAAAQIAVAAATGIAGISMQDLTSFMVIVGRTASELIVHLRNVQIAAAQMTFGVSTRVSDIIASVNAAGKAQEAFNQAFGPNGEGLLPQPTAGALDTWGQGLIDSLDNAASGAAATATNPFETLVNAERIQEIIMRVATEGKATWADVAQLWELGAHDAAQDFAHFMRGEISDIGGQIDRSFKAVALRWMDSVQKGILEGTLDVLDALEFLQKGMIDAARSIVEGLSVQADHMAEAWQILVKTIEAGMVDIRDVGRLFDIGDIAGARELLAFMAGRPSAIDAAIEAFRRAQGAIFTRGFQHGGFVPAGPPIPAMLHGPEVVVPLGNQGAMMNALSMISAGLGGIGSAGGFRNYGQVSIVTPDSNSRLLRSMQRALGA